MPEQAVALVRKLWHYCNILRDDGLSYPDYVEQLTYLLFLKMSDEQEDGPVPAHSSWRSFANLDAGPMHERYSQALSALGRERGLLGRVFSNAKNKIRDPEKLQMLVRDLIGQTEWTGLSPDVKGDAYEGLLEKNARDTKSGAGQYFTPRPLVDAIVTCVDPKPGEVICDPACGTGGFLLSAFEHVRRQGSGLCLTRQEHLRARAIRGVELVEEVARLASMNLLLHGIGGIKDDDLPIECADSLRSPYKDRVDVVLTNPPFGIKGNVQASRKQQGGNESRDIRDDFWVQTPNKQLSFLQHIVAMLRPGGRAAVVVPDNVLYESGAAATIRRRLLETCKVHTILRLPAGLFYAQSVKANVIFFELSSVEETDPQGLLWVYDFRRDNRFSLKNLPLHRSDLDGFVRGFGLCQSRGWKAEALELVADPRWRPFSISELIRSDQCSLDLSWDDGIRTENAQPLARLEELSRLIAADLRRALDSLS